MRGDGPLKLIVDHAGKVVEAYDLVADPGEQKNVADARRAEADAMAAAFQGWMAAQLAGDGRAAPVAPRDLSAEEEERLRALGYLE